MMKKIIILMMSVLSFIPLIAQSADGNKNNVTPDQACEIAESLIKTDPVKALEWAKFAYDNADDWISAIESAKLLGIIYLKGGKEVYDYDLAIKYLREGAENDQPECIELMKALGEPYEEAIQTVSPAIRHSGE